MSNKVGYVSFVRPVNTDTVSNLLATCASMAMQQCAEIHLLISSPGGQLIPGFGAFNQLKALPTTLVTHNIGSVNSIANIIFLSGRRRLATPTATFLLHGTMWNLNGDIERARLVEIVASLQADETRMIDIMCAETGCERNILADAINLGATKDATWALEKGFVHETAMPQIPQGAPFAQI